MKQMSLSKVCKQYGFTRRVIQCYEKEGLIKSAGKNKYGYLMYDEDQIDKIAYIRYLQINGMSLKEIRLCLTLNVSEFGAILQASNEKLKKEINKTKDLILRNEEIIKLCSKDISEKEMKKEVFKKIMEELDDEKTI